MSKETDGWIRVFEVIEPQRHRKGFTVYKVISRVFHKNSIEGITEIVTFKRFSEFKKLHKSLSALHSSLHLKGVFPSFPETKVFGRFDTEVIESRRQSALELLEFSGKYPPLFTSSVFVKFFENSVTNFTTVSKHHVIDSPTHEDNHLPQPLEPNLNASDNWSQKSGDNPSDGSGYYSTPIHSMVDSTNESNSVTNTTNLKEFDPLVKTNDNSVESPQQKNSEESNQWLIYAIQSCDYDNKDSEVKSTKSDKTDDILLPEPFAETQIEDPIEKFIPNPEVLINEFSISCDVNDPVPEEVVKQNTETIPNSSETNDTYLLDAAIILRQAQQYEEK